MSEHLARPARTAEAISEWVDLEAVVVLPERGTVHLLNATAARVWSLLDGACTLREIAARIAQEYDVGALQAEADVLEVVSEFKRRGMLAAGPENM